MNIAKHLLRPVVRRLPALALALAIVPALASDASAQFRRAGGYSYAPQVYNRGYSYAPQAYNRGYSYAPQVYNRGYSYAPQVYNQQGYGYAPQVYNRGYMNPGITYGNAYRAPFYPPGARLGFGGFR